LATKMLAPTIQFSNNNHATREHLQANNTHSVFSQTPNSELSC
jgi:hypothetical protein